MAESPDTSPTTSTSNTPTQRTVLSQWVALAVGAAVLAATVLVLIGLWRWIDGLALADVEKKAAAHLDAVKVAASIAFGGGGLFALYLAARRQRTQELELDARRAELAQRDRAQAHIEQVAEQTRTHAERTAASTEQDAAERRITELYTKAADQLGSDKAAVRLAGLYAFERLGQNTDSQRVTIGNVVCAYLRMPYVAPEPLSNDASSEDRLHHQRRSEELQVRNTALRILARHTRLGGVEHWATLRIDLTGAALNLADLSAVNLNYANLTRANLTGANLTGASLTNARLIGANLTGANLTSANLTRAELHDADLTGADLNKASLTGVQLTRADLTRANLSDATVIHADLTCVNLTDANLTDANLIHADLHDADLTRTNLTGANVSGANLAGANLTGAVTTDATNWMDTEGRVR